LIIIIVLLGEKVKCWQKSNWAEINF